MSPTAARKAAASQPAAKPEPKPRQTEFERAEAAYQKAKAKTDKSWAKYTALSDKANEAKDAYEADKRTSNYLYAHPALAEARVTAGTISANSIKVDSVGSQEAFVRSGTAVGEAPPVATDETNEPELVVPEGANQDPADWEAAAPTPAPLADPNDPFGGVAPGQDPFSSPFD